MAWLRSPLLLPVALFALVVPAAGFPNYGTYVDQTCTANAWIPAKPFNPNGVTNPTAKNSNCGLCHTNAANPGKSLTTAGQTFKSSRYKDVSPFCHPPAPMNHAPVFAAVGLQQATVGDPFQLAVSATDVDGDAVALSVSNNPTGSTFTDNGNRSGVFQWTPGPAQTGNFTVTFHATDAGTPMASATLDVTISVGVVTNHPPVLAAIGNQQVDPAVQLALTFSATDVDGDALTFSVRPMPMGATLNGAQFSWTPTAAQVGTYPVTVTVTDNGSPVANDSEAIVITVGRINHPPVLSPIGSRTVDLGTTGRIPLVSSDPDSDPIALACTGLPGDATLTDLHDGTGEIVWSPTAAGMYSTTCSATDNGMPPLADSETFTLSAHDPAPPPGSPSITDASWYTRGAGGALRVSGNLPEEGMGKGARVEIFALLANGTPIKLGEGAPKGEEDFAITLAPFIAPCQVAAATNGLMGAAMPVADAPTDCDTRPFLQVKAKASCDGFTLNVKGRRAPAGALITGTNPETGDVVFTHQTTRAGSFRVKTRVDSFVHALAVSLQAGGATWTLPDAVPVHTPCD
jgi:hypothetical protein